jgi:hypothetical protein
VPSCIFLIGPRNKKSTKKRFSRKNYSSTVLNYELTFVMKMITKAPPTPPPAFRPPFDWAPIDQNTRLGTWKLGRVSSLFFEALYDEFHKKCERVIGNGGRIIFSAKSFFRAFFYCAGQSEKGSLALGRASTYKTFIQPHARI